MFAPIKPIPCREPRPSKGNLYYVRLKTSLGVFYKLGFTTLETVEKRLAFQGSGDERYIDEVLCFLSLEDAYDVEQKLHAYFREQAIFPVPAPDMPFFGNGQSELYAEDILKIDRAYSKAQEEETRINIWRAVMKRSGVTDDEIQQRIKQQQDLNEAMRFIEKPLVWLMRTYVRLIDFVLGRPKADCHDDVQSDIELILLDLRRAARRQLLAKLTEKLQRMPVK